MINRRILRHATLLLCMACLVAQRCIAQGDWDLLKNRLIILGDMHYDRLEDHDLNWLQTEHPDDYRQVTQEYTVYTQANFADLISELLVHANAQQVSAMVQLGDLQEGLAGNQALAEQMGRHATEALRSTDFTAPWVLTKGNHDITGPGAPEAYTQVILPFLQEELRQPVGSPSFSFKTGGASKDIEIIAVDCYDENNIIQYLRMQLSASTAKYKFVATHKPIIPVTGRLWHVFESPTDSLRRDTLMSVIAEHKAVVLCAHLHHFSVVSRMTRSGPLVQVMVNSVIRDRNRTTPYMSTTEYGPSLVDLEPNFTPGSRATRMKYLANEARFVTSFQLADMPGYAILDMSDTMKGTTLKAYAGLGQHLYKEVSLAEYDLTVDTVGHGSILFDPPWPTLLSGTRVKLHAVPALGWFFSGWSGALAGIANPDSLVMDGDKEVTASFSQFPEGQCELRVNVNGSGTVELNPPGPTYPKGTVVIVTAHPDARNAFTGWSGAIAGTALQDSVTLEEHVSVTASFRQLLNFRLNTRSTSGGAVILDPPGMTHLEGTEVVAEAVAEEGWEFVGWTGALQGLNNPATVLMTGPEEVKARFRKVGSQILQLAPAEDSYVRGSLYSSRNFDNDSLLRVREGGADLYRCRAYLQFDLSAVSGTLLHATLLLHSRTANAFPDGVPVNVFACRTASDSWTETALTWKNTPVEGTEIDSTMYLACENNTYMWDLTACVAEELAGDKKLSIMLKDKTALDRTVNFDARETAFAPLLELLTTTGPDEVVGEGVRPREFRLEQNYPNPFNPTTVVSSQLPVVSEVKLVVYDVLGRKVATLVNERRAAGSYRDVFDGSSLASGPYVYRLTAGPHALSRQMLLIK